MEQENTYPLQLIDDCLRGVATTDEQSLLLAWRGENPRHEQYFQQVQRIYQLTNVKAESYTPNTEAAWQKLQARIAKTEETLPKKGKPSAKIISMNGWMKLAASVLISIGFSVWAHNAWNSSPAMVEVASGNASKMIYLPDSSQVWLRSNTKVSYASNFNDNNRRVVLDGAAFFEVRKRDGMPFRVVGHRTVTKVLGTSFLVNAYKESLSETIEVVTGKVQFSSQNKPSESAILLPGDGASFTEGEKMKLQKTEAGNPMFLKTEKLRFNNEKLSVILQLLHENYAEEIALQQPSLGDCRFTGSFEKSSLEEILNVLALAVNAQISKSKQGYLLSGVGCEPLSP